MDCPGHASLIKTVLGGASIIDMMILVVDANKGAETAGYLVVGGVTTIGARRAEQSGHVRGEDAQEKVGKIQAKLANVFNKTKFKDARCYGEKRTGGGFAGVGRRWTAADRRGRTQDETLELIPEVKERERGGAFCSPSITVSVKGQGAVLTGRAAGGIRLGIR